MPFIDVAQYTIYTKSHVNQIKKMGLISNPLSLIITYTAVEIPFTTILMSGFISNIPSEIEEVAAIDGWSKLQALRFVMFPFLLPGIVATGVLHSSILGMNSF